MQREDLEHIICAAAALTKESDFIIIGSQAIFGQYPVAPQVLRVSMEADIYPRDRPELADQIDGSLGMDSPFDATFGYHADGVSPGTATCRTAGPDGSPRSATRTPMEPLAGAWRSTTWRSRNTRPAAKRTSATRLRY